MTQTDKTAPAPQPKSTLFVLHALGMDAGEWGPLTPHLQESLGPQVEIVPLNLAGFGANRSNRFTCREMADAVAARVAARETAGWMIAGHSMGGRIAMLVAAMAEAGAAGLSGLSHVMLVASSTLPPEPIPEDARARMLSWVEDGTSLTQAQAEAFIADNVARALPEAVSQFAQASLRAADPLAWRHWLTRGSREDWSTFVPLLQTPALIVAGAEDGPLGETTQRDTNGAAFADAHVTVIDDCAHLIPLEQPERLAAAVVTFITQTHPLTAMPSAYAELLLSDRVTARTRAALTARMRKRAPGEGRETATALAQAVLPDFEKAVPDLVARLYEDVESAGGDGWRFDDLPPDAEAFAKGLAALNDLAQVKDGNDFAAMSATHRDALLTEIATEDGQDPDDWTARQMARWFADLRARLVRLYVAHPAVMARMGYDGFANGGDGPRQQGFLTTAADTREGWQPAPAHSRTGEAQ